MEPKVMPEAAAVADLVKELHNPQIVEVERGSKNAAKLLLVPKGYEIVDIKDTLDAYLDAPERKKGTAEFTELDSFIAHVDRFADDDSALFADRNPSAPSLICVLDYHRANEEEKEEGEGVEVAIIPGEPRFGQHRSRYAFPLSDEWVAWTAKNGKQMSQADFAVFLEDRIADLMDPIGSALESTKKMAEALLCSFAPPSRLLELARGLTVRSESIVANAQNLKSGESVIRFETTHTDERGAPLDVPGAFIIGIPVFRGGDRFSLGARLRYRVKEGRVTWWFDLYRASEVFDFAFNEACKRASGETGLPLFMGKPET